VQHPAIGVELVVRALIVNSGSPLYAWIFGLLWLIALSVACRWVFRNPRYIGSAAPKHGRPVPFIGAAAGTAALLAWLLYSLGEALVAGRIKWPCRTNCRDLYAHMDDSPFAFWGYFGIVYMLTLLLAWVLVLGVHQFSRVRRNAP
jgi:hypothetical protein